HLSCKTTDSYRSSSGRCRGCGSPVVKVSDHVRHVMSSSSVPLKTHRVEERCSSRWCVATTNGVGVSVPAPSSYVIKFLQNKLIQDCESWCSNSNTGLRVKLYFPRHILDISPHSSYVTQFLTNQGPFASYLHRFKLKPTTNCLCGSVGDANHYVFVRPLTKDFHLVSPPQNAKKAWFQSGPALAVLPSRTKMKNSKQRNIVKKKDKLFTSFPNRERYTPITLE
ncbi:uncharacterized protein TNCV_1924401, partial [Trichonephila clavipes]